MNRVNGALAYLIARSVRNRIKRQLGRLRKPRYAIAMLVGIAYFGFFFLGWGRDTPSVPTSPEASALSSSWSNTMTLVVVGGLSATVILWWLAGGVASALAFGAGEVQFLFSGPISRRALLAYRVIRAQLLILLNALIWMVLIRRWGIALPAPMRFANAWVLFSFLSLHRMGAALVLLPNARGPRRVAGLVGKGLALGIAVVVLLGVLPALPHLQNGDFPAAAAALGSALSQPPAMYALAPFRAMLAPLSALTPDAWWRAFAVALAIIVAHVVWVLSMNVPFEESAAISSEAHARRLAAFRERGFAGATVKQKKIRHGWPPLAPTGRASIAIVWKNTIALIRGGVVKSILLYVVLMLVFTSISSSGSAGEDRWVALMPAAMLSLMTALMGPGVLRNDLRQDLLSLSLIKTYPIRGAEIVAAEIASPVLVLTAIQLVLIGIGVVGALPVLGPGALLSGALVVPLGLLAVNSTMFSIHNGVALIFPGWTKFGPEGGGIEAMGQSLVLMVGSLVALVVGLILPVALGLLAFFGLRDLIGGFAVAAGAASAAIVLLAEVAFAISALGRVFENTDQTALT